MTNPRALSDCELTELEQQRAYLLSSLDDLDAEHEAGDIADDDYAALRDDYTRRTANVARAVRARRAAVATRAADTSSPGRQRLLTIAGVIAVAVVAGFFLARSVGFRSSTDAATGDVRASTRSLNLEAQQLASTGDFVAAIERFDAALEIQPSNAEALTYKAWFRYLSDESAAVEPEVEALLEAAIASEPTYADARVFRAVLFANQDRFEEASSDLAAFDQSNPPPQMVDVVTGQGLRERVLAGLISAADPSAEFSVDDYDVSAETMARAARIAFLNGDAGPAIRAYGAALEADPDNITALLGRGELLVVTGQQSLGSDDTDSADLIASGRESIQRAVELDPTNPRAHILLLQAAVLDGDGATVEVELAALDGLDLTEEEQQEVDAWAATADAG